MKFLTPENADNLPFVAQLIPTRKDKLIHLPGGSRSFAFLAENKVYRFPKAEIVWESMRREAAILKTIYPVLQEKFAHKIHPIKLYEKEYPYSVSPYLNGKICDNRPEGPHAAQYANLSGEQQNKLAYQIAAFFDLMHRIDYQNIPIPPFAEDLSSWDITTAPDFDEPTIQNLLHRLSQGKIDLYQYKTKKPNMDIALCHNDLAGSNLLISPENDDILSGIIDFANTDIVPKYHDFFSLYKINRKLALETLWEYNKLTLSPISQNQIDYLALTYIGYGFFKSKDDNNPYFQRLLKQFL